MEKENIKKKCFQLLQKVMQEAFQMDVVYLTPPYENFHEIDHGIRNMVWSDFLEKGQRKDYGLENADQRLVVIRSNLGFYNVLAVLEYGEQPDMIFVGPFRAEEFSAKFFSTLMKNSHISVEAATNLQYIYEGFPYVQLTSVINITKQILAVYFPEFENMESVQMEFSDQEEANIIEVNTEMLQEYTEDVAEAYQNSLMKFIAALGKGDIEAVRKAIKKYLKVSRLLSGESIDECKRDLHLINDCCHMVMFQTHIHPSYILKLYASIRIKINRLTSRDMISGMINDICHKYCLLVKNYTFPEYSKTICDVINYIYMHLDEKLTLALLAEHFKKNAASLSNSFSKEVGVSVTEFIHQARINEAVKYFNMTELSVSEVAVAVGFQDFAYFSRLFKKQIGCSPREYCKSVR